MDWKRHGRALLLVLGTVGGFAAIIAGLVYIPLLVFQFFGLNGLFVVVGLIVFSVLYAAAYNDA